MILSSAIYRFIHIENHIARDAPVFEEEAAHIENAWKRELARHLSYLETSLPFRVALRFRSRQLIHAAKRRLVIRGCKLRANAPAHNVRALLANRFDRILIQIVREHDAAIGKPRLIQHAPGHLREPRQVARVDADARQALAPGAHLKAHRDGVADALLHVVGVHEQHAVARELARVSAKGLELVGETT